MFTKSTDSPDGKYNTLQLFFYHAFYSRKQSLRAAINLLAGYETMHVKLAKFANDALPESLSITLYA